MSDVFDYLSWRGDLTFDRDGFNCIDALILSRLSYLPFEQLVPAETGGGVKLSFVSLAFSSGESSDEILWKSDPELLKAAAESERFGSVTLSGFVNERDSESKKQFSAVIFSCENMHFVAFRGTDASFVGWQEDFNLFIEETVPSQNRAIEYLEHALKSLSGDFYIGGHSKGGNLAIYSALLCNEKALERVLGIYNFDGPGFRREICESERYAKIKDRLHSFVPQSSVFGMMLEHEEDFTIVKSNQIGFMQHDIYSWELLGKEFVCLKERTNSSIYLNSAFEDFLSNMTEEDKRLFTQAFFSVLGDSDSADFKELLKNPVRSSAQIIKSLTSLDKAKQDALAKAVRTAIKSAGHNIVNNG